MSTSKPVSKAVPRVAWVIVGLGYIIAALAFFLLKEPGELSPAVPVSIIIAALVTGYAFSFSAWIKSPNCGRDFRKGKYINPIETGLHMGIPYFRHIEVVSQDWNQTDFEDFELFPLNDTEGNKDDPKPENASAKGVVQFRPKKGKAALRLSLAMGLKEMEQQIDDLCVSNLHTEISGKKISELLDKTSTITEKMDKQIAELCKQFGYEHKGLELNLNFPRLTQRADGRTRAANARDMADSIRDNTQAAAVTVAREFGETAISIWGGKASQKKTADKIAESLENISEKLGAAK